MKTQVTFICSICGAEFSQEHAAEAQAHEDGHFRPDDLRIAACYAYGEASRSPMNIVVRRPDGRYATYTFQGTTGDLDTLLHINNRPKGDRRPGVLLSADEKGILDA